MRKKIPQFRQMTIFISYSNFFSPKIVIVTWTPACFNVNATVIVVLLIAFDHGLTKTDEMSTGAVRRTASLHE
jgi:hypothetical protein